MNAVYLDYILKETSLLLRLVLLEVELISDLEQARWKTQQVLRHAGLNIAGQLLDDNKPENPTML